MAAHVGYLSILLLLFISELAMVEPYLPFCQYTFDYFQHCLDFLVGDYYKPSKKCCNHIKKLNVIAKRSRRNPQRLCYCIENMVKGTQPPLISDRINALPVVCHTHLSFPISSSMDCSKVV